MMDTARKGKFASAWLPVVALVSLLAVTGAIVACSSGSSMTASGMSTVNLRVSDPATCAAPNGPYSNVWVTITDVQVNTSSSAGPNDSSWVDLTPNLASSPKQIDLLAQANNQCFLASLGDNLQLQAGSYQQIRIILADNSTSIANNNCSNGAANCVVVNGTATTLQLASEDKTGIKIPSGQIASGAFTISAGQTKDLDIDFNTCESIVQLGNGGYILKPVLHAGEVSTTSTSINGTVDMVDANGNAVTGGSAWVALEQPDLAGVDRVAQQAMVASDGTFVFCPLPQGTYDVVVVGMDSTGTLFAPSIITGVSTGSTAGAIKLNAPAVSIATVSSANLTGLVSTAGTSGGIAETVTLSALETVNGKTYTIPQQPAASPYFSTTQNVVTAASTSTVTCPNGTFCAAYSLPVTSSGAYYGAWSASGSTLQPASATTVLADYFADGSANCSNSPQNSGAGIQLTGAGPFNTTAGVAMTQNITLTGCQ